MIVVFNGGTISNYIKHNIVKLITLGKLRWMGFVNTLNKKSNISWKMTGTTYDMNKINGPKT